jgi:hypothetical protein
MIEYFQGALGTRRRQSMVERRSSVDANEGASIHSAAYDLQAAAAQDGEHQQYSETGDTENQANSVRNAVRQFLDLDG